MNLIFQIIPTYFFSSQQEIDSLVIIICYEWTRSYEGKMWDILPIYFLIMWQVRCSQMFLATIGYRIPQVFMKSVKFGCLKIWGGLAF